MLKNRVISGVTLAAALLALVFLLPVQFTVAVLLVFTALGLWEFYGLLDSARIPNFKLFGIASGLALVAATWSDLRCPCLKDAGAGVAWIVVAAVIAIVLVRQFPQRNNARPFETVSGTLLGFFYVAFLLNFLTLLLVWPGGGDGRLLILYFLFIVKFSDIGAYFIGCRWGRHKLFPRLSPAKTWEGCAGGVLTSVAVSLVWLAVTKGDLGVVRIGWEDAVILGLLLPVLGIFGDLVESMFKRASGKKDSSGLIMGMGGVLDIIDSILLTAPAMYAYAVLVLERAG